MAFDNQTTAETRLLTFDFSNTVGTGVTLSTPVIAKSVLSGPGLVGDLTLGTAAVVDLTVTALATGVVDGTRYRLKATAHGSDGEIFEVARDLTISNSASLVA